MKIRDIPKIERPREKLIRYGAGRLSNSELLALLLRSGKKGENARLYLTPEEVWKELKDIRDHKKEHFVIFFLDSRNQEIKQELISVGSLNANLVHPREVFEP
jgi:DNA repair protein RadC